MMKSFQVPVGDVEEANAVLSAIYRSKFMVDEPIMIEEASAGALSRLANDVAAWIEDRLDDELAKSAFVEWRKAGSHRDRIMKLAQSVVVGEGWRRLEPSEKIRHVHGLCAPLVLEHEEAVDLVGVIEGERERSGA
jgi:hypothetical protein